MSSDDGYSIGVSLGSLYWSQCVFGSANKHLVTDHGTRTAPAILCPRLPGEPYRLDLFFPSHPRGSGCDWPSESRIDRRSGAGRIPLALAWTGLRHGQIWRWQSGAEVTSETTFDLAEVISRAYLYLLSRVSDSSEDITTIVIPNYFTQSQQQEILDQCSDAKSRIQLLWAPIAATIGTLHSSNPITDSHHVEFLVDQTILIVKADWDLITLTPVGLKFDLESKSVLPARKRPVSVDHELCSFGWQVTAAHDMAATTGLWQRLFTEPNPSFNDALDRNRQEVLGKTIPEAIQGWNLKPSEMPDVMRSLVDDIRQQPATQSGTLAGIVVYGDLATAITQTAEWKGLTEQLENEAGRLIPIVIAAGQRGEDLLAMGAAWHSQAIRNNRTSYLDTLPQIELFIDKGEKTEWKSLVEDSEQFVAGGKEWRPSVPISGLSIKPGSSQLNLVVWHEEYEALREWRATLGYVSPEATPVELQVSLAPAQGNAKLVVVPTRRGHPTESVVANWKRMSEVLEDGQPVLKADYEKRLPKAFPPLSPRRSSYSKWRLMESPVNKLIELYDTRGYEAILADRRLLTVIKDRLQAKDQSQTPNDATAIGSDFLVPRAPEHTFFRTTENEQEKLIKVAKILKMALFASSAKAGAARDSIIRALGYMSADDPEVERWMFTNRNAPSTARNAIQHSCGLLLRDTNYIATFIRELFEGTPNSDELKGISQILRYRTAATQNLTSLECESMIAKANSRFRQEMQNKRGRSLAFRWAALIVVYLLRRRMFDANFLPPEGELAMEAKNLFEEAIEQHRKRILQPLGGSVDLPAALRQMVDYIDKRGSGEILMAQD